MAPNNSSSSGLLSERYASALYNLSSEKGCLKKIIDDLNKILIFSKENIDLSLTLKNPLISSVDKKEIINNLLKKIKANSLLFDFIRVLEKNKRFNFLTNIIYKLNEINSKKRGNIISTIISAEELSIKNKDNIKDRLIKILGNRLSINYKIDKSIIGGLIIKIDSVMIDSSLLTKIDKIKLKMKE